MAIRLDISSFDRAMREYQSATRKDMATVVNRSMNSWAINGAKVIETAIESKIRDMTGKAWWPKLIASIMVKRAARRVAKAMSKESKRGAAGKTSLKKFQAGRFYTRDQARRVSRSIINKRLKARLFLRGFFLRWSQAIALVVPGVKGPLSAIRTGAKFFAGVNADYRPATPASLSASVRVSYDYKKRSGHGLAMVNAMFEKAKAAALAMTIADMTKYARELMAKRASEMNVRRLS